MSEHDRGQVSGCAAEVYEEFFLPALFAEWPDRLITAVKIRLGERVLDVACGTGVLARAVADRVGDQRLVVGLDVNDGMLAVAHRKAPGSNGARAAPNRCRSWTRASTRSSANSV
jgi:ubiquinone/menaquinone biosynthesis C-methylase UbiE